MQTLTRGTHVEQTDGMSTTGEAKITIRGPSAKTVAVLVMALFGSGIVVAVGVVVAILVGGHKREKELDQKFAQAQTFEKQWETMYPQLSDQVGELEKRDAESVKILNDVAAQVSRAMSMTLEIPSLEPKPEVESAPPQITESDAKAPEAEEESAAALEAKATGDGDAKDEGAAADAKESEVSAEAEGKDDAKAADDAGSDEGENTEAATDDASTETANEQAEEDAQPETPPAAEIPEIPAIPEVVAPPPPPALAAAHELFAPAKAIRALLRKAEALRDTPDATIQELKRATLNDKIWQEYQSRTQVREEHIEQVKGMIDQADKLLVEMKRRVITFEKEAATFFAELQKQQEQARIAREAAAAEEAKRLEDARKQAQIQEEIYYINGLVAQRSQMVNKYEYGKLAADLERVRQDVVTEGGQEALEVAITRFRRLDSLKDFLLNDMHEHNGLRWGMGQVDIVDADKEAIIVMGGRRIPTEEITIGQWLNFIVKLLEARPPERHIRVIQYGEQLFNAAIFCVVHGGGSDAALDKAAKLVDMALERRTVLRPDVPRLLPELSNREAAPADEYE